MTGMRPPVWGGRQCGRCARSRPGTRLATGGAGVTKGGGGGRHGVGILDRPGRHLHRCGGRGAGRAAGDRASCCPRTPNAIAMPRCRASAIAWGWRAGEPIPDGGDCGGQDGHHGRHQRPAGAQGRAGAAADHRRLWPTFCASAPRRGPRCSTCTSGGPICCMNAVAEVPGRLDADGAEVRPAGRGGGAGGAARGPCRGHSRRWRWR